MAGWISSKLKVAEDFLHQIDQQAAESLKKNENQRFDEALGLETSNQVSATKPLLKEQLKKKPVQDNNDLIGKSKSYSYSSNIIAQNNVLSNTSIRDKESVGSLGKSDTIMSTPQRNLTDSDWTELLSVPSKSGDSVGNRGSNGFSGVRRDRRDGKKLGSLVTRQNVGGLDAKRVQKGKARVLKSDRKSDVQSENKANGGGDVDISSEKGRDVGDESRTSSSSGVSRNDDDSVQTGYFKRKDSNANLFVESKDEVVNLQKDALVGVGNESQLQSQDDSVTADVKNDSERVRDNERLGITDRLVDGPIVNSKISGSTKGTPLSPQNEESDSETDSDSSSSSESEREREERRKRRQQILAEKAAAKASEAIKEREDHVAKLEGEKQSLEKILEERAKQQVLEASELQTTMMETMEAVELEKQKHNNTRMEALASLAKLETKNAELARAFASVQKTLELETNRVTDIRRQIELKEASLEEVQRKMSSVHESSNNLAAPKGVEFERDILEAEYSYLTDKVERLQEKAKKLDETISSTRRELENPTEVELELKRRLGQLTDHLIQKQAQVEALSSEKALLLFKIEAVSRSLDENKHTLDSADSRVDLESGLLEIPNSSKFRPLLEERLRLGKQHFGSLVLQLDSIFCAGAVFLRRNSTARIWSMVYLVCLHIWVIYILMSHSPVSDEASSGAVVSLQSINNTGAP